MGAERLHGLDLPIPDGWTADHLYRFKLPVTAAPRLFGPQRSAPEPEASLVIGAYPRGNFVTPEALLAELNRVRQARDPRFVVLAVRRGRIDGQAAVVQDSTSGTPSGGLIYQREVVVPRPESLTMLVVTVPRLQGLEDACAGFLSLDPEEVPASTGGAAPLRASSARGR